MAEMLKYTKIGQFRNVVREVREKASFAGLDDNDEPIFKQPERYPIIEFEGTVKLHGTNAAVVQTNDGIHYQSRNRVLTTDDDNLGFAKFADAIDWTGMFDEIREASGQSEIETIAVYGEWCGKGIQSGVAINQLPKMFVIFSIRVNDEWLPERIKPDAEGVYCVDDFTSFMQFIDFNVPEQSHELLVEVTNDVERQCPFAYLGFNVEGIGEGIVWTSSCGNYRFKVKGEKHSKTKVKTLNPVDIEKLEGVRALAATLMTERRLDQGFEYLEEMGFPLSRRHTGDYLKYVVNDCIEEETLAIEEAGYEPKDLNKSLSEIAKKHFFKVEAENYAE